MNHRTAVSALLAALALTTTLAACSPAPDTDPPTAHATGARYEEPAWMAKTRLTIEEGNTRMASCLGRQGWDVEAQADGTLDTGDLNDEQQQAFSQAVDGCFETAYGSQPAWDEDHWSVKYDHALDTRECLIAQGYQISEPPSRESWVAAGLAEQDLWAPYQSILDKAMVGAIPMDAATWTALQQACPQDGPTIVYSP